MTNTSDQQGLFYVETIGGRWSTSPVPYSSLERAREDYERSAKSGSYMRVMLWDCTASPVGIKLAST